MLDHFFNISDLAKFHHSLQIPSTKISINLDALGLNTNNTKHKESPQVQIENNNTIKGPQELT